jgi:DUF971 family protein
MTHDPQAIKPRNLAIAGRELALAWADGHESYLPFDELRSHCPCSLCRGQREAPPDPLRIVKAPARGQVAIRKLVLVGIHSFESLRASCPCPECASRA